MFAPMPVCLILLGLLLRRQNTLKHNMFADFSGSINSNWGYCSGVLLDKGPVLCFP